MLYNGKVTVIFRGLVLLTLMQKCKRIRERVSIPLTQDISVLDRVLIDDIDDMTDDEVSFVLDLNLESQNKSFKVYISASIQNHVPSNYDAKNLSKRREPFIIF